MSRATFPLSRLVAAAGVCAAALTLAVGTASAAPIVEEIVAIPSTVAPGATVTIDGSGWDCNIDVAVSVSGAADPSFSFEDTAAPADGGITLQFTAPTVPGVYTVSAAYTFECQGSAETTFTVEAPVTTTTELAATPVTPALPSTGASSQLAIVAGLLMLLGAVAIALRSAGRNRASRLLQR